MVKKVRTNLLDAVDGKQSVAEADIEISEAEVELTLQILNKGKTRSTRDNDSDDEGSKSKKRKRSTMWTRDEVRDYLYQKKKAEQEKQKGTTKTTPQLKRNDFNDSITIDELNTSDHEDDLDDIVVIPEVPVPQLQVLRDIENVVQSTQLEQQISSNRLRAAIQEEEKQVEQRVSRIVEAISDSPPPPVEEEEVEDRGEKISIQVRIGKEEVLKFNIGTKNTFEKLMNGISKKKGIPKEQFKLLFDGQSLKPNQTPEDLDMEDDDLIELKM